MTLLGDAQAKVAEHAARRAAAKEAAEALVVLEEEEVAALKESQRRRRYRERLGTEAYDPTTLRGKEYVVVEDLVFQEVPSVRTPTPPGARQTLEVAAQTLYVLGVSSESLATESYRPTSDYGRRTVYAFPLEVKDDLVDLVRSHPTAVFQADGVLALLANGAVVHTVTGR